MSSVQFVIMAKKKKLRTYDTESTPNRKLPRLDMIFPLPRGGRPLVEVPICGHQFCTLRFKIVGGPIELGYNDICAWKWYSTRGLYHFGESYAEFACKEEFEEGESVGLKPKRKNQNKKQPKTKSRGLEFTYGSTSELWILFCVWVSVRVRI